MEISLDELNYLTEPTGEKYNIMISDFTEVFEVTVTHCELNISLVFK